MTQEDKQLLLKDLCARIPYGVTVELRGSYEDGEKYVRDEEFDAPMLSYLYDDEASIKPYLRPMSSMTEQEKEYYSIYGFDMQGAVCAIQIIDWLNAHHFDYCGLIKKGLALEAKEGMYD